MGSAASVDERSPTETDANQDNRGLDYEEEVADSRLDHLVPAEQRHEPDALQSTEPEVLDPWAGEVGDADEVLDTRERVAAVRSFQESCKLVEETAKAARTWAAQAVADLDLVLAAKVQRQTPQQQDFEARQQVMARCNHTIAHGLLQYRGLRVDHYGSFTSGLFTPSGDLDIAIEGTLRLHPSSNKRDAAIDGLEGQNVSALYQQEKAVLLKAFCKRLKQMQLCDGRVEMILTARVPIIKFRESRSGVDCDVAVGSGGARFKSTVLRHLSQIDTRFPDLVRIVKLWAKAFHLNDAANGTFNTFALTLMVVFHLQTRSPPILPPICELFDLPAESIAERPLHMGHLADENHMMELLKGSEQRATAWRGKGNSETLLELLSSFFALFSNAVAIWNDSPPDRAVRCSTWAGRWAYKQWSKNYLVPIEDPFDATDCCARSIFKVNVGYVRDAFQKSLAVLQYLPDSNILSRVDEALFTSRPTPNIRHPFAGSRRDGGFKQGWQEGGWGRKRGGGEGRGIAGDNRGEGGLPQDDGKGSSTSRSQQQHPRQQNGARSNESWREPALGLSNGRSDGNWRQPATAQQTAPLPAQPQQQLESARDYSNANLHIPVPPPGFQQRHMPKTEYTANSATRQATPGYAATQGFMGQVMPPPGFNSGFPGAAQMPGLAQMPGWMPPGYAPQQQPHFLLPQQSMPQYMPPAVLARATSHGTSSHGSRELPHRPVNGTLQGPPDLRLTPSLPPAAQAAQPQLKAQPDQQQIQFGWWPQGQAAAAAVASTAPQPGPLPRAAPAAVALPAQPPGFTAAAHKLAAEPSRAKGSSGSGKFSTGTQSDLSLPSQAPAPPPGFAGWKPTIQAASPAPDALAHGHHRPASPRREKVAHLQQLFAEAGQRAQQRGPSQEALAAMLPGSLDLDFSMGPSWNGPVAHAPAGDSSAAVGSGRRSKPTVGDSTAAREVSQPTDVIEILGVNLHGQSSSEQATSKKSGRRSRRSKKGHE